MNHQQIAKSDSSPGTTCLLIITESYISQYNTTYSILMLTSNSQWDILMEIKTPQSPIKQVF
jgi:hypothetical protein